MALVMDLHPIKGVSSTKYIYFVPLTPPPPPAVKIVFTSYCSPPPVQKNLEIIIDL
jgi:hypothetical protein